MPVSVCVTAQTPASAAIQPGSAYSPSNWDIQKISCYHFGENS
jgi:hypothetical protein